MSVSRNPDDYEGTRHLMYRAKERDITGDEMRRCIEEGDVEPATGHGVRFSLDLGIDSLVVVADPVEKTIMTAYFEE